MTTIAIDTLATEREYAFKALGERPEITKITDAGEVYDSDYFRIIIETSWTEGEFDYWLNGDGVMFETIMTFDMNKGPNEVMMDI